MFLFQEDPRLKFPVHLRSKASLNPNDLGPLPVSAVVCVFSMRALHHLIQRCSHTLYVGSHIAVIPCLTTLKLCLETAPKALW